jgi:hypothetical protein
MELIMMHRAGVTYHTPRPHPENVDGVGERDRAWVLSTGVEPGV